MINVHKGPLDDGEPIKFSKESVGGILSSNGLAHVAVGVVANVIRYATFLHDMLSGPESESMKRELIERSQEVYGDEPDLSDDDKIRRGVTAMAEDYMLKAMSSSVMMNNLAMAGIAHMLDRLSDVLKEKGDLKSARAVSEIVRVIRVVGTANKIAGIGLANRELTIPERGCACEGCDRLWEILKEDAPHNVPLSHVGILLNMSGLGPLRSRLDLIEAYESDPKAEAFEIPSFLSMVREFTSMSEEDTNVMDEALMALFQEIGDKAQLRGLMNTIAMKTREVADEEAKAAMDSPDQPLPEFDPEAIARELGIKFGMVEDEDTNTGDEDE